MQTPTDIAIADLGTLPRRDQRSDFHCVTAWTRCDAAWGGWRFRDVYHEFLVRLRQPDAGVRYVMFKGLDGFRSSLPLKDVLVDDVLLADRLDGQPLSLTHGAPLRVMAPRHYAYKSVKHLVAIELRRAQPREVVGLIHPRARDPGGVAALALSSPHPADRVVLPAHRAAERLSVKPAPYCSHLPTPMRPPVVKGRKIP